MNRPIRLNAVALVLLAAAALPGCGSASSAPVVVAGSDEGIVTGATFGGDVARGLTSARPAAAQQTDQADATTTQLSRLVEAEDVRDALYGLSWDVGCEIVTSEVHSDAASVRTRLLQRALDLGLVFADQPTIDHLVGELLGTFDVDVQGDLYATCVELSI